MRQPMPRMTAEAEQMIAAAKRYQRPLAIGLVQAIRLALTVPKANGQTLLVGDREQVTWRDFCEAVAVGIVVDPSTNGQ